MIAGIVLGVGSALGSMVIADTQQAHVDVLFDLQRSSRVVVQAEVTPQAGFPKSQVELVHELEPVSEVGELSIWVREATVTRSWAADPELAPVFAADAGGLAASGTTILAGAPTSLLAARGGLPVAWVGAALARRLAVGPASTFRTAEEAQVIVNGVPLGVAGVLASSSGFDYLSGAVVVSRPTAVAHLAMQDASVRLVAHTRPGSAAAVAAYLLATVDYDGGLLLRDVTPPDGETLVGRVGSDLRRVGLALALIVGLVGMLSVANTLMISVHNRTRELGLRSAIGWSRRRIGSLVLAESALAGAVAGFVGAALGSAAAAAWCWSHGWSLVLAPGALLMAVCGGLVASVIGGIAPAYRAASVSPLSAMRS